MKNLNVSVLIPTKDKYYTTLPLCLHNIANQTLSPNEIIILDNNKPDKRIDLRHDPIYDIIFKILELRNIKWSVLYSYDMNDIRSKINNDYIWKINDDLVPEQNVLQILSNNINPKTGSIGSLFLNSELVNDKYIYSSKIEHIYKHLNEQCNFESEKFDYKLVDYLYGSYIFKTEAINNHDNDVSKESYIKDILFTYGMKINGWEVAINTNCIIWNFEDPKNKIDLTTENEIFKNKLKEWKIETD